MSEDNQRVHERVSVKFALTVFDAGRLLGTIEDISEGGMRVKLDMDIGDNTEVREWTGNRGPDNKEFVLSNLVGEQFDLVIKYLSVNVGNISARLIRVIRSTNRLYFAMQFVEPDAAMVQKMMGIVRRRAS